MTRIWLVAAAVFLAAAAPADAMVQLDKGIAGVRIGNTRAAGRRVTSFSIASGKVTSVQVGIVLD